MSLLFVTMLMVFAILVVPTVQSVVVTSSNQESRDGVVISTTTSTPRVMKRVNVWTEKDKAGRTVLRGDARAKKAYQNAQRVKGVTTISAMVLGLMLLVVPDFIQHAAAMLGSCLFGISGITTSDDVKNRLAARLVENNNSKGKNEGGTRRLEEGGISIDGPEEFLDGRQRYNSFDGVTTFPAGIDETLQRERKAGEHPQYKVMIIHGGTQASMAKNPAGSDGGFPIGTIGTSVRRAAMLRTALSDENATIVDLNILSERDRAIQQPTANRSGTAKAILPTTGPLTSVGWVHTDSNGKVTLWDIDGNGVGLLGTGLDGGGKDIIALGWNSVSNQIKIVGQGWIPVVAIVGDNDGYTFPPVSSIGNTSLICDLAFDEVVPEDQTPPGATKRLQCDRQDKVPVNHLPGATLKKAAYFAFLTGIDRPGNYPVYVSDVRNPVNNEAIMLEQWTLIKEHEDPGYGPEGPLDKDDVNTFSKMDSMKLGCGSDASNLKSPVNENVINQYSDLWLSDATKITPARLYKIITGSIGSKSLISSISKCLTNAFKQICGSGWSPDIDASDVDLQRDKTKMINITNYIGDDVPMGERVSILESAQISAAKQAYKNAVRGTTIRKVRVNVNTYIVPSEICPYPIMEISVMTHLTDACDIMMKDVPVLVEAILTKQSHRVRSDVNYVHLEHEFWQEGITSLEQSNHPKLVALARVLDIIGDNHWLNGALRKDGFSNHVNRDGGGKQPFRNEY